MLALEHDHDIDQIEQAPERLVRPAVRGEQNRVRGGDRPEQAADLGGARPGQLQQLGGLGRSEPVRTVRFVVELDHDRQGRPRQRPQMVCTLVTCGSPTSTNPAAISAR